MTTTIQAFSSFLEIITPTNSQMEVVSARCSRTEEYLKEAFPSASDLPLRRVFLIGSASRKTLIRPVDDIDVIAVFDNKDEVFSRYRYQSGQFLQRVRTALQAKTTIQNIGARGQAVRLFYKATPHVDIAPVFSSSGGGYYLPSGDGGWITTNPETQDVWFQERRNELGSSLVGLIKILKRWNNIHSRHWQSYHLEVATAKVFKSIGGFPTALQCFFEYAPGHIDCTDPAGHSGNLSAYLTYASRRALLLRLSEAEKRATFAINAAASGNHDEAKRLWHIELGDEFPA